MKTKSRILSVANEQSYLQNKARIYMLRCLLETDCFTRFAQRSNSFSEVAEFLGFYHICDSDEIFNKSKDKEKLKSEILKHCQNALDSLVVRERQGKIGKYKIFSDNLALLKQTLHLSDTDLALIELTMVVTEIGIFEEFLDDAYQSRTSHRDIFLTIATMLDCSYNAVAFALSTNSILRKMSILDSVRRFGRSIKDTLTFYNDDFADALLVEHNNNTTLMSHFVVPCEKSALNLSDYAHIKELDSLICYLRFAKDSRKKGVNILLYGTPGTGKTEFAKILAQNIGANLYRVRVRDDEGDAEDGMARVGSYLLAQRFLDSTKDILLYDEAEDVLNCTKGRFTNKAFFNDALENNVVPTIWITNAIYFVDSAAVRRFDFAIAMNAPKKGVRKAMLEKICGEKLDKKTRKLVQKSPNLAPALINRANEISSVIEGDFSKNFLMILNNTLRAQGYSTIKKDKDKVSKNALPKSYSTDFINADCDISRVASGLGENPNARICLYGLSGTGKSAFAQFIAKSLKRPCIIKAVSDLESMWVGETEQNIARAFKEAKDKKAVLVFDEVDSFLRDRRLARQSWEATKVNEMLLQMEKFNGIFVATTNLMDNIDKAALRRFDLKVEFKALNRAQRVNLFKKECAFLGLKCEVRVEKQIERLECLTPGDFAAVKRQHKFNPIKDAMDFYARLCEEVKVKDLRESGANMGVGFLR